MADIPTKPPIIPIWGNGAAPGDLVKPADAYIEIGWPLTTTPPPREYWNWEINYTVNAVRYLSRSGIPVYDAAETYMIGDLTVSNQLIYRCVVNNTIGLDPASGSAAWAVPAVPSAVLNDATNQIASTAWVVRQLGGYALVGGTYPNMSVGFATSAASATAAGSAGTAGSVAWTGVTGKPSTVGGYGITNAITSDNTANQGTSGPFQINGILRVGSGTVGGAIALGAAASAPGISSDGTNVGVNVPAGSFLINNQFAATENWVDDNFYTANQVNQNFLSLTGAAAQYAQLVSFANSLSQNGFARFPGGLVFQWGVGQGSGTNPTLVTITFPISFPNACFVAVANTISRSTGGSQGSGYTYSLSPGQATFVFDNVNTPSGTVAGNYIAIGH